jgi:hypothetical protein
MATCHPERKHKARGLCGSCYVLYLRAHSERAVQVRRKRDRQRYAENREQFVQKARAYRATHPDRVRATRTRSPYGLELLQVDAMLTAQGGVCAICGETFGSRGPFVDHDHETGQVRGMLCDSCNWFLGRVEKAVGSGRLQAALEYLRKYREAA